MENNLPDPALESPGALKPIQRLQALSSLGSLANQAVEWRRRFEPVFALQERLSARPSWLSQLVASQNALSRVWRPAGLGLEKMMRDLGAIARVMSERKAECDRIEAAGWLPHYTTPFEKLSTATDADDVAAILERHYTDNWPAVKEAFLVRLNQYDLDDGAKASFGYALAAHDAGLFGLTTPYLFIEIERIARRQLHNGALEGFTSQPLLREAAGELYLDDFEPNGTYGMRLFEKLLEHIYAKTKTPEAVTAVAADPVPNRHAALHGLVSYDSRQNSLNMLIMTDFIYQVFSAQKRRSAEAPTA